MKTGRTAPLAALAILACSLCFPQQTFSATPGERVLFRDPFPEAAVHDTAVDLLIAWHRAGVRGAPLVRLASTDGFYHPSGALPDTEEIGRLLEEGKYDELKRRSSPLPFSENILSPANAVQAAWRLGIISEMVWVMPLVQTISEEDHRRWKGIYRNSVDKAAGESLTYRDGVMRGSFMSMPVTIVDPGKLPSLDSGKALFAIDLSFLTTLKGNARTLTPMKVLSETILLLQSAESPAVAADAVWSFYGGGGPLYHLFLLEALLPVVRDPQLLGRTVDPLWLELSRAHEMERLSMRSEALTIASRLTESRPSSPHPWYFAAVLHFRRGWEESCINLLREANSRDPSFLYGFVEIAAMATNTGRQGFVRPLLEEAERLAPGDPLVLYQLANLSRGEGRCEEAGAYYGRLMKALWPFEELKDLMGDCPPSPSGEEGGAGSR